MAKAIALAAYEVARSNFTADSDADRYTVWDIRATDSGEIGSVGAATLLDPWED